VLQSAMQIGTPRIKSAVSTLASYNQFPVAKSTCGLRKCFFPSGAKHFRNRISIDSARCEDFGLRDSLMDE